MIFSGFYRRHAIWYIEQFLFKAKILGYHLQIYEQGFTCRTFLISHLVNDLDIEILRDFMVTLVT